MATVVFFGECMAELRSLGERRWIQDFAGDTYNTAVYLRRLDRARAHSVEYACGFGDDPFAADMLEAWRAEGVGGRHARSVPGRGTGLYTVSVDAEGERRFAYWREASAAREYFAVPQTPLEAHAGEIDLFYLSGISLAILPPQGIERLLAVCDSVRRRGGKVAFDNNYRPHLWPGAEQAAATMQLVFERCDIAFVTLDDQMRLSAMPDPERAVQACLRLPAGEVIVKRGSASTLVRDPAGEVVEVETCAARVVDTTAAGDSFAAGYLFARWAGALPEGAAAAGNALAARVIGHPGALMPRDALESDAAFWRLLADATAPGSAASPSSLRCVTPKRMKP